MVREIQIISRVIFLVSLSIELMWAVDTIIASEYYYDIVLIPLSTIISIFFINSLIYNILAVIIPSAWLKGNTYYYTDTFSTNKSYKFPSLTIIVPIYKESFTGTIKPTLEQALEVCKNYSSATNSIAANATATANIYVCDDGFVHVSDDERHERLAFYNDNIEYLSFIARPPSGRRGKFKKAGNLNFALSSDACVVGDIILLIDSDTRMPIKSLYKAVAEFNNPRVGFVQMKTTAMLSTVPTFWERLVAHFTNTIYEVSFVVTSAYGDPSPLVGHNVFIRKSVLEECVKYSLIQSYQTCEFTEEGLIYAVQDNKEVRQFFSEEQVSEDFELSMRLQDGGYIGRYCASVDGFQEGVTLNVVDEIIRLQKYAYGVNELVFNSISKWCSHGILTKTFKQYILSPNITLASKYNVIGYMGTYYALASTPIMVTIHYFAYHYCNFWRMKILNAESILYGCLAVFTVLTPIAIIVLKMKLGLRLSIIKELLYSIVFGVFFSGIGWSMMLAIASHLFGVNMSWGSTNKDGWSVKAYLYELRKMWPMYIFCFGQLTMIGFGWFLLDLRAWPAIVPMALSAAAHIIIPLFSLM